MNELLETETVMRTAPKVRDNGITETRSQALIEAEFNMLLRAYHNRTRQYNFFKLYSDVLDGSISEEEYERELNENEDKYVLPEPEETPAADIEVAYRLSQRMKGIDSTEDFTSLFSISNRSLLDHDITDTNGNNI